MQLSRLLSSTSFATGTGFPLNSASHSNVRWHFHAHGSWFLDVGGKEKDVVEARAWQLVLLPSSARFLTICLCNLEKAEATVFPTSPFGWVKRPYSGIAIAKKKKKKKKKKIKK